MDYVYTLWQNDQFVGRIIPQKKKDEYAHRPPVSVFGHMVAVTTGRPAQSICQMRAPFASENQFVQFPEFDIVVSAKYDPAEDEFSSDSLPETARAEDLYEVRKDNHTMDLDHLILTRVVLPDEAMAAVFLEALGLPGDVREVWQVARMATTGAADRREHRCEAVVEYFPIRLYRHTSTRRHVNQGP